MNIDLLLLLFFILGATAACGVFWLMKLKQKYTFTLGAWFFISSGLMILLFALAWAISSLIEFENQAAGMGLLIFGGSSLICFSIAARLIIQKSNAKQLE